MRTQADLRGSLSAVSFVTVTVNDPITFIQESTHTMSAEVIIILMLLAFILGMMMGISLLRS